MVIESKPLIPACSRCAHTGLVVLEKNSVEYAFACVCRRGKERHANIRNYLWGLENGYRMTDNTQLMFKQYDEIVNQIKVDGKVYVNDHLPYKDPEESEVNI